MGGRTAGVGTPPGGGGGGGWAPTAPWYPGGGWEHEVAKKIHSTAIAKPADMGSGFQHQAGAGPPRCSGPAAPGLACPYGGSGTQCKGPLSRQMASRSAITTFFEGGKADTAVVMPPQAHRELQVKQNKQHTFPMGARARGRASGRECHQAAMAGAVAQPRRVRLHGHACQSGFSFITIMTQRLQEISTVRSVGSSVSRCTTSTLSTSSPPGLPLSLGTHARTHARTHVRTSARAHGCLYACPCV